MTEQNYQTYTEAPAPNPAPVYTEPPQKKGGKGWLIALIIVLLLCCCLAIAAGVVYYLVDSGQYRFEWSMLTPLLSYL
ncbi:MAG: hypothetical protein KBA05_02620 [Anaerolineaceae bacterium]|jgi:cytochrome c-type biogenesis protein CcmH/NrfG|nr:hypothetical protein [Anaerolineaceae bacterium]MDI9530735.1 hypothetical protein [Chloroflexota bacterium]HOF28609.1 hypothetical protein [Anaerolineaceae bacterium]HOG77464.1 hypothetical protein [Anaerolineaceae bacterium]